MDERTLIIVVGILLGLWNMVVTACAVYYLGIESEERGTADQARDDQLTRIEEQLRINSNKEGLATITEMQDGGCNVTLMMPARRRYTVDLVVEGVNEGKPARIVDRDPRLAGDPREEGDDRLKGDARLEGDVRLNGDERLEGDPRLEGDERRI